MNRPSLEEVELALLVAHPSADIGPNVACVLAAEVRALRAEVERLIGNIRADHAALLAREAEVSKLREELETERMRRTRTCTGRARARARARRIEP